MLCRGTGSTLFSAFLTSFLALAGIDLRAQNPWTGLGASPLWSDSANWYTGFTPTAYDAVYFEDVIASGYTNVSGAVNNVLDANYSVGALLHTANSSGTNLHFYTTLIPGGVTLSLGGFGAIFPALSVGDVPGSRPMAERGQCGRTTQLSLVRADSSVSDSASLMSVGQRNRATLDLERVEHVFGYYSAAPDWRQHRQPQ